MGNIFGLPSLFDKAIFNGIPISPSAFVIVVTIFFFISFLYSACTIGKVVKKHKWFFVCNLSLSLLWFLLLILISVRAIPVSSNTGMTVTFESYPSVWLWMMLIIQIIVLVISGIASIITRGEIQGVGQIKDKDLAQFIGFIGFLIPIGIQYFACRKWLLGAIHLFVIVATNASILAIGLSAMLPNSSSTLPNRTISMILMAAILVVALVINAVKCVRVYKTGKLSKR